MNNKNVFDKERFAQLLDKAKGDRSINKYAEETKVSAAHISRFLRKMIDAPPTPETISKLSSKAHNNISYRDFMAAAGHISLNQEKIESTSPNENLIEIIKLEKQLFQIMLSYLYKLPFDWNIKKPNTNIKFPNMIIDLDHKDYTKWLIKFIGYPESSSGIGFSPQDIYGMISITDINPKDKFSIIVNSEEIYNKFFKIPPLSLRANIYLMLVDLKKSTVVKEEKLSSY